MLTVGLTGNSGAGKGIVASLFARYGIPSIDTDAVYRELLIPPSELLDRLTRHFGTGILFPDGTLNRKALAAFVFTDDDQLARFCRHNLEWLNDTTHRAILEEVRIRLSHMKEEGYPAVLVDAPQLFESGFDKECDRILVVHATYPTLRARIMERDGLTEEQAKARLRSQMSPCEYRKRGDDVISNNGNMTLEGLDAQVKKILATWEVPYEI